MVSRQGNHCEYYFIHKLFLFLNKIIYSEKKDKHQIFILYNKLIKNIFINHI